MRPKFDFSGSGYVAKGVGEAREQFAWDFDKGYAQN